MKNYKKDAAGFALIEVLLAVVVLAIGLLAGSKMQILGINYTQGSMTRSHASIAANDIIDRMRLNPAGVENGEYDFESTALLPADPGCMATGCNAAQLADHDLRMWARHFGGGDSTATSTPLPPGSVGTISEPDATSGMHTIKIEWKDYVEGEEETQSISIGVIVI